MSDYIKREDAEKVVADYLDLIGYARRFAKSVLDNAPSADVVERKELEALERKLAIHEKAMAKVLADHTEPTEREGE